MSNIETLATKAANGDSSAFENLYKQTYKSVYFTCLHFLKNEQNALDITQDTYFTAFTQLKNLQDKSKCNAWLMKIAANKCRDYLKRRQPVPMDEEMMEEQVGVQVEEDELNLPEEYVVNKEKRKVVMDIMQKQLSDALYQTVILYYFDNLSVADIAEIMECPEGTVKYRLSVARAKIKEGVLAYEKKSGVKLYSVAGTPFLAAILMAEAEAVGIVCAPLSFSLSTAVSGAESLVATKGAKAGGKIMFETLKSKIIAGIIGVLLVGGVIATVVADKDSKKEESSGQVSEESYVENDYTDESYEENDYLDEWSDSESVESEEVVSDETSPYEDAGILPAEKLFNEDEEAYTSIESIQGQIVALGSAANRPVFMTGDTVYSISFLASALIEDLSVENVAWMKCVDSLIYGKIILVYTSEGKLSAYNEVGEPIFVDLDYNDETDVIVELDLSILQMIRPQGNEYEIFYYECDDAGRLTLIKQNVITEYTHYVIDTEYTEYAAQSGELVVIPSSAYATGRQIYYLTPNNDWYAIEEFMSNGKVAMWDKPVLTNVSRVYYDNSIWRTGGPIYAKAGDNAKIYAKIIGDNWISSEDDIEISFILPDGHTTEDIKNILGSEDYPMIEFTNGDVYCAEEIDEEIPAEYTFTKLEAVSELNAEGKIVQMVGPIWQSDILYILMDDNKVYYIEL